MTNSIRFLDTDGFEWQVRQVNTSSAETEPFGREDRWLYFFSRFATRKLSDFPADWSSRRWWELEALCAKASPVGTRPEVPFFERRVREARLNG